SIIIQFDVDRATPISTYLADSGLSREEVRRWDQVYRSVAKSPLLHRDHPLTIYKDPQTGDLRGFKYALDEQFEVYEAHLGSGVIRAYQIPIQYQVKPVSVAFEIGEGFRKS